MSGLALIGVERIGLLEMTGSERTCVDWLLTGLEETGADWIGLLEWIGNDWL
jgi:hypothetical protein